MKECHLPTQGRISNRLHFYKDAWKQYPCHPLSSLTFCLLFLISGCNLNYAKGNCNNADMAGRTSQADYPPLLYPFWIRLSENGNPFFTDYWFLLLINWWNNKTIKEGKTAKYTASTGKLIPSTVWNFPDFFIFIPRISLSKTNNFQ